MTTRRNRLAAGIALSLLVAGSTWGAEIRYSVPAGGSPSIGPADAPVTLVEFLDYQ